VLPTDLTVSAVVENDGKFLIIEERSSGVVVVNQPGGHLESGESPKEAATREALEEAGCAIKVTGLLGVYLWIHPQTRQNHLRIVYVADLISQETDLTSSELSVLFQVAAHIMDPFDSADLTLGAASVRYDSSGDPYLDWSGSYNSGSVSNPTTVGTGLGSAGESVIIVTAHFGQFELMPTHWANHYGPLNIVIRPLDNQLLDSTLRRKRSRYGCRVLTRRGIVRNALRCLRSGEIVAMTIDQNMTRREGVFVDFDQLHQLAVGGQTTQVEARLFELVAITVVELEPVPVPLVRPEFPV